MSDFDLIVKNGRVATAADISSCDIGVRKGRIVALAEHLTGSATRTIDAEGRWVTPGGVDAHCHLDQPSKDGSVAADDFTTGTRSALAGGTTTVIPFAIQFRGQSLPEAIKAYHQRADGKALTDYAFHVIVTDPTAQVVGQEIPAVINDGYTSFKMYMTYDDLKLNDRQILEVLSVVREHQGMAMIHAENTECIAWLTDQLEAAGKIEPRYHAASRPRAVEREATHRAITLAELVDVPVLIVHVSARDAIEEIRRGQSRGLRIFAETCPQYLFLTEDDLAKPDFEGAKCLCSPPPRDKGNQQVVWDALLDGTLSVFSSDHAPTRFDDPRGKKIRGTSAPFRYIPNGIPGIETRLPLLFSEGVGKGRMDINAFVAATSTNPAKIYGLYPRKGTIAIGADADLVIWDAERSITVTNSALHHNVDYTPYEGMELKGWPEIVISRGDVVVESGEVSAQTGRGQFLRCERPATAIPPVRSPLGH